VPLLVVPIKRDLGLTDTQISLLMGFAFVMFYAQRHRPAPATRRPKPCGSSPFSMPSVFQTVVESGLSAFSRDKWLSSRSDGNLPKGPMAQRNDTRGAGFPG
jgi:hypothetical protein